MGSPGCHEQRLQGPLLPGAARRSWCPKGVEGRVPYKGTLSREPCSSCMGGLRAGMGYCGTRNHRLTCRSSCQFVRITSAGSAREPSPRYLYHQGSAQLLPSQATSKNLRQNTSISPRLQTGACTHYVRTLTRLRSIFSDVHAAEKNGLHSIPASCRNSARQLIRQNASTPAQQGCFSAYWNGSISWETLISSCKVFLHYSIFVRIEFIYVSPFPPPSAAAACPR